MKLGWFFLSSNSLDCETSRERQDVDVSLVSYYCGDKFRGLEAS